MILNSLLTSANKSKYRKSKRFKSKSYSILVLSRISHEYPLVIHGYILDIHWMSGSRYPVDIVWLSALDPNDILILTSNGYPSHNRQDIGIKRISRISWRYPEDIMCRLGGSHEFHVPLVFQCWQPTLLFGLN